MTVEELIEALKKMPPKALVVCWDGNEEHSLASGVIKMPARQCYTYNCGGGNELHFIKEKSPRKTVVEIY